jgi:two-component system, NtrC family, response regulator HydG
MNGALEMPPAPGARPTVPEARVLVVDDEPLLREFLEETLRRAGHTVELASGAEEALRRIPLDPPDAILLDIRMHGRDGLSLLPELRLLCPEAPVIMMTGHGSLESAVSALRLGAFDYLTKPFPAEAIELALSRALSVRALRRENADLRGRLSLQEAFTAMIGRSRAMEDLRTAIRMIAPTRSTVLVLGESGAGKELVARAIHEGSPRAGGPFVKLNCAAVPAGLLESELFGHERGAFTGAVGRSRGKFEQANGGTLLLDEISEMDLALQPKLLRALQEREFYRVGGSVPVQVDVRLLATTNTDLKARVREGSFREDLYNRLEVVPVRVPPLRERKEDVLILAQHFLVLLSAENGKQGLRLGREASERLLRHDWPGNVRELRNAVERAVILCPQEELRGEHFVLELGLPSRPGPAEHGSAGDTLYEREKEWILQILQQEGGNRTAAARRLDVSVRTVRNKLALYQRDEREQLLARQAAG